MAFNEPTLKYKDKDPKRLYTTLSNINTEDTTHKSNFSSFSKSKSCDFCKEWPPFAADHPDCLICNKNICRLCCGHYSFPREYNNSSNDFSGIVCLICRDQVLLEKQETTGECTSLRPYRKYDQKYGKVALTAPDIWEPKDYTGSCGQCGNRYSHNTKIHNCRVCGICVEEDCSVEWRLPDGAHARLTTSFLNARYII